MRRGGEEEYGMEGECYQSYYFSPPLSGRENNGAFSDGHCGNKPLYPNYSAMKYPITAISIFPACCVIQLTQQSPLGLPCSGEEVVLQCTLPGILVFWGFPGGEETVAPSSTEQVTGNFRAQPVGVINGNFTSILTFPAQNGTVITCFNEDKTMNISHKVTVQGTQWYINLWNYCRVSPALQHVHAGCRPFFQKLYTSYFPWNLSFFLLARVCYTAASASGDVILCIQTMH